MSCLYLPNTESKHFYKVNCSIEQRGDRTYNHVTDYNISVEVQSSIFAPCLMRVVKNDPVVNQKKTIHNPVDELFQKGAEPLDELLLVLDKRGYIKGIKNHKQVLERWNRSKIYIEQTFESEYVTPILEVMERNIHDEQRLTAVLHREPFFNFYFHGLYGNYGENGFTIRDSLLPDFAGKDYLLKEHLNLFQQDEETMYVELRGNYSIQEEVVSVKGRYFFDKKDNSIQKAEIHIDATINGNITILILTIIKTT